MLFTMKLLLPTFFTLVCLASCSKKEVSEPTSQFPELGKIPHTVWEKLAQKKIYFGHQSVGNNILDGIRDLIREHSQITLNIAETTDPVDFDSGLLAHSRVGRNSDPSSKFDAFEGYLTTGIGQKTDMASLKLCYVDIGPDSDVDRILSDYDRVINRVKKNYPGMTLVHFTAPLTSIQTGPKAWVKTIIGKPLGGIDDNIKRNEYNAKLIKKYNTKDPIFDLANIESTFPNGARATFSKYGQKYYAMVPQYTHDGGHLNDLGRKHVATQFLIFLTSLVE